MKSHINLTLTEDKIKSELGIAVSTPESMNVPICNSTQQSKSDEVSDDFLIPANIKPTVLNNGYYLVVLCLCWLLRNKDHYENRYQKIKTIADLKNSGDIFKCLDDIVQGNANGKRLLGRMVGIKPKVYAASVSIIYDLKAKGKLIPHHFSVARGFDSTKLQVEVKEADDNFRAFNILDYKNLRSLYQAEDGTFDLSDAITSLFTDIVLSCFMDRKPNIHLVTSGSKQGFVDLVDVGELELEDSDGKRKKLKEIYGKLDLLGVEPSARSAAFLFKFHKYFKRLHLNDADQRFYNFLWCLKNYPLYVISDIITFNCDEDLNKLREKATKRGKKSGDVSALVQIMNFMATQCNMFSDSVRDRVRAAAWLFLWVNMSFSGNFNSYISKDLLNIKNLYSMLPEVLSAALVLQKAEISCMDCVDFTKKFINNTLSVIFADPPYVDIFGSACKTYSIKMPKDFVANNSKRTVKALKPFGIEKIKELFSLLSAAKGKVLITHSNEHEVNLAAYCRGLDYLFSYSNKANGCNEDGYETIVLSKNIHEEGFVRDNDKTYINETLQSIFQRRDSGANLPKRGED